VGHASLTRSLCPRLQRSKVTSMTTTQEPDTRSERNYGTDPGDPARAATIGGVGEMLSAEAVSRFVSAAFAEAELDGERVCLVVPDGTRTCPLPLLLQSLDRFDPCSPRCRCRCLSCDAAAVVRRSAIVLAAIGVECHGCTCSRTTPRRGGTPHRTSPYDHLRQTGGFGALGR